jgi:ribonucleoside-diphosphate reductase alpha chain
VLALIDKILSTGTTSTKINGRHAMLKEKIQDEQTYSDTWSSIIANDGSCQHLDIFDEAQKDVFKTSMEINERWVIELAAKGQAYIDQAQSLNLFFRPDAHIKYIHAIHFMAWKKGLKTLYYCYTRKDW